MVIFLNSAGERISKDEYLKSKQKVEEKPKVFLVWCFFVFAKHLLLSFAFYVIVDYHNFITHLFPQYETSLILSGLSFSGEGVGMGQGLGSKARS